MADIEYDEFLTKCANIPYEDYSWLKDHCYRTLKRPCSPNVRNEHLAVLDLIKEHEEKQEPKIGHWIDDKCSVCGKGIEDLIDSREWYRNEEPNFCPFCGVKIESEESESKRYAELAKSYVQGLRAGLAESESK